MLCKKKPVPNEVMELLNCVCTSECSPRKCAFRKIALNVHQHVSVMPAANKTIYATFMTTEITMKVKAVRIDPRKPSNTSFLLFCLKGPFKTLTGYMKGLYQNYYIFEIKVGSKNKVANGCLLMEGLQNTL